MSFQMNGTFWNFKGLGDTKQFKFLSDLTIGKKTLDFIVLLKTSKRECSETFLKTFCDEKEFLWHYKPPQG
jgi:hypothetical protein